MRTQIQQLGFRAYQRVEKLSLFKISFVDSIFVSIYLFYKRHLEARDYGSLKDFFNENSVVVDIGAAMGFYTEIFAKWVAPAGKVYAFEPDLQNYKRLERHISKLSEKISRNIFLENIGISNSSGYLGFRVDPSHPGNHKIDKRSNLTIPVETLDSFCIKNSVEPNFIKIDVQGHEHEVLIGSFDVISKYKPLLFIEFDFKENYENANNSWQLLESYNYLPFKLSKTGIFERCERADFAKTNLNQQDYFDLLWAHEESPLCLPTKSQ